MNFIDTYKVDVNLCDKLIKYWKNNKEYKHEGSFGSEQVDKTIKNSTDVIFFNSSKDTYIKEFFKKLSICVTQYCSKYKIDTLINNLNKKIFFESKIIDKNFQIELHQLIRKIRTYKGNSEHSDIAFMEKNV